MRGIDYRSFGNAMFLVVAKQFPSTREALQGLARVGRFGDECRRIKFADVGDLVDGEAQAAGIGRLGALLE